jgi:hypothetical protein
MAACGEPTIKNHIRRSAASLNSYIRRLQGNSDRELFPVGNSLKRIPCMSALTVYTSLKEVNPAAG